MSEPVRNPNARKQAQTAAAQADRRAELRRQQEAAAAATRRNRMLAIGAGIVALVLVVIGVVWGAKQLGRTSASAAAPAHLTAARDGVIIEPSATPSAGAKTVQVFQDYQCPNCKQFEASYGDQLVKLAASGDIRLEAHVLTFLDQNLSNDASTRAARAAMCADSAGTFAEANVAIYAAQPATEGQGYSDQFLTSDLPAKVGITGAALSAYQTCVKGGAMGSYVSGMNDANQKLLLEKTGNVSTPTVLVNGVKMDMPALAKANVLTSDPVSIKAAIDATS